MKIGIYDGDLKSGRSKLAAPSLICAKLSTHYKKLGHKVFLEQDLTNHNKYDMLIVRQDRRKPPSLAPVATATNVKVSGISFLGEGETLKAVKPEIERLKADIELYDPLWRMRIATSPEKEKTMKEWRQWRTSNFYQLYYSWGVYPYARAKINKGKHFLLYDRDLTANKGWAEELDRVKAKTHAKSRCLFPINVRTEEDFYLVNNTEGLSRVKPNRFFYYLEKNDLPSFFENNREKFVQTNHVSCVPIHSLDSADILLAIEDTLTLRKMGFRVDIGIPLEFELSISNGMKVLLTAMNRGYGGSLNALYQKNKLYCETFEEIKDATICNLEMGKYAYKN